jgi:malonyl CoA-acyl carrier protein transacylase
MKSVWMFPGQGSQRKGMGAGLFERYPELVAQADEVLGASLAELCLHDPEGVLGRTEYTQPALFAVSALSFLARRDDGVALPTCYAGHSLGEFNALFAAGAFDFRTGMALVTKRGELMSKAPHGAMAAVIGLDAGRVHDVLAASGLDTVDVANINSGSQIVVSGLHADIERSEAAFVAAGARHVRLNVSAAFHSRYMREVEADFASFVEGLVAEGRLRPLVADVISNRTARPHARDAYLPQLIEQISHPVRWYESISWLLAQGATVCEEVGPGDVLGGLFAKIRKDPMPIAHEDASMPAPAPAKPRTVFMYSGQGVQYYGMGRELYAQHPVFREAMDGCNAIYREMTGRDMVDELYDDRMKWREMTDIMLSHPALYSVGYGLTRTMQAEGIEPDCVLGYSLGEYMASVAAGVLAHEDAMRIVVRQAMLLKSAAAAGGMLSVIAPVEHFEQRPELYRGTVLGSVNYGGNFVVSGDGAALDAVAAALKEAAIVSVRLPLEYPFHSPLMAPMEPAFLALFEGVAIGAPRLPIYSSMTASSLHRVDAGHYWDVGFKQVDFRAAVAAVVAQGPCRFVDIGPSGTLSSFIKYGFGDRLQHVATINQFGRNAETIADATGRLAA